MKWTLVTGGAKGLGAEISMALAKEGFSVLVHYRKSWKEANQVAEVCRSHGVCSEIIQGDFSSITSLNEFIQRCHKQFPSIENVINNVGNYLIKKATETALEEWESIFQTNLHAPFALSTCFLNSIRANQGSIINIGVVGLSSARAEVQRTAYMVAKMSLWMLTKSLARELAHEGIRVNMVSPGYLENSVDLPEDLSKLPMMRPAALCEVSRMICFLLQKQNSYITGQNIEVGGGINL